MCFVVYNYSDMGTSTKQQPEKVYGQVAHPRHNSAELSAIRKRHPLFKWVLVMGIALVANLFLNYALDAFYPSPKYETFCPQKQVQEAVLTKEACLAKGGQWSENVVSPKQYGIYQDLIPAQSIVGNCNENYTCNRNFGDAMSVYNRNVFIVLVVAGTAMLMGSIFVANIEAIALGFSFAGIFSLLVGTVRYWGDMNDRLRVVVLGVALVALVWIGIKKFKD